LVILSEKIKDIRCNCDFCTKQDSCCTNFEVTLTPPEAYRVEQLYPFIVKYRKDLAVKGGFDNVFDECSDDRGLWVIEKDDEGKCPFEYLGPNNEQFCAVHTAALDVGENPLDRKPIVCSLWPLCMVEDSKVVELTADPAVESYHCVSKAKRKNPPPETLELIQRMKAFFATVSE
jgi:hypothetical protein